MAVFDIKEPEDIANRRMSLDARLITQKQKMRDLDPWVYLNREEVEAVIWEGVAENVPRETVQDNSINSITKTLAGFLTGRRPTITVNAKNQTSAEQEQAADKFERLGYALLDTINKERATAIEDELVWMGAHRGVIILHVLHLDPDERGAEYEEVTPFISPDLAEGIVPDIQVNEEGDFPILMVVRDPLDCYWELDDKDQVVEFIHEYKCSLSQLVRRYPSVKDMDWWGKGGYTLSTDMGDSTVTVSDYWDDDINAICVDETHWIKEPTEHDYYCLPVVVELVDPIIVRDGHNGLSYKEATPFCHNILDMVIHFSKMMSLSLTYLKQGVHTTYNLKNSDPATSYHWSSKKDTSAAGTTGPGVPSFDLQASFSPSGQIIPTGPGEELVPLQPAPLVPAVEALKGYFSNAIAKGSFNEGILTGLFPAEPPSGHAVVQMQMATTARMKPLRKATGRAGGKGFRIAGKLIADEWDRGDNPITLSQLAGQEATQYEEIQYTKADFEAISSIYLDVNPDVELDKEQKSAAVIQEFTSGLLPPVDAIRALNRVQDPHLAMLQVALHQESMQNPAIRASLAAEALRIMGISMAQPQQPAAPPGMPPGGVPPMGGAPPPGGMPVDPMAMMGGAPPMGPPGMGAPPVDPAMAMANGGGPPGQPPMDPQMLMQLMQMLGGQAGPPQGGPF